MRSTPGWLAGCFGIIATFTVSAKAQEFPARPVTIYVGNAAGGIVDTTSRLYAAVVSKNVGQPIVIESRPAGGGAAAATAVQNAPPDGYSLLVFSGAQHAAVPAMQNASYDALSGFEPITMIFSIANLLTVPVDSPANSVSELLALGRKKSGGLLFGAPGAGSPPHLLAAQIAASQNVPMQFVQYRGGAPMMTDLITGRIDAALPVYILVQSFLAERKVKVLAIDAPARWPVLADVPTLSEVGLRDEKVATWFAVAAPAGTPKATVQRWRDEFIKASADAELKQKLTATGTQVVTSTSEELQMLLSQEVTRMKRLVSQFGLKQP